MIVNGGITPTELAKFRAEQGHVGMPKDEVCKGDALSLYDGLFIQNPATLNEAINKAVGRPGKPTWGTCR